MTQSSPIAITMGDACGIGPEIVARTLAKGGERAIVYGSRAVMADIVHRLGVDLSVRRVPGPLAETPKAGCIDVVEVTRITEPPPLGMISPVSGQAAFDAIAAAKAG